MVTWFRLPRRRVDLAFTCRNPASSLSTFLTWSPRMMSASISVGTRDVGGRGVAVGQVVPAAPAQAPIVLWGVLQPSVIPSRLPVAPALVQDLAGSVSPMAEPGPDRPLLPETHGGLGRRDGRLEEPRVDGLGVGCQDTLTGRLGPGVHATWWPSGQASSQAQ